MIVFIYCYLFIIEIFYNIFIFCGDFISFYLKHAPALVEEVGYVPLPDDVYELALKRFNNRVTGSVFFGRNTVGAKLEDLLGS